MCSMLRQHEYSDAIVAIAFPEFPVFSNLVGRTEGALHKLGLRVLFVSEAGTVRIIGDPIE